MVGAYRRKLANGHQLSQKLLKASMHAMVRFEEGTPLPSTSAKCKRKLLVIFCLEPPHEKQEGIQSAR